MSSYLIKIFTPENDTTIYIFDEKMDRNVSNNVDTISYQFNTVSIHFHTDSIRGVESILYTHGHVAMLLKKKESM